MFIILYAVSTFVGSASKSRQPETQFAEQGCRTYFYDFPKEQQARKIPDLQINEYILLALEERL